MTGVPTAFRGGALIFDPLLPWPLLAGMAVLALLALAFALWRGLSGWALRGLAAALLLVALVNPALERGARRPLSDIVLAVVDESASQQLSGRAAQTRAALDWLRAQIAAMPDTELRVVRVPDGTEDQGTQLMTHLAQALAEEPRARVAGVVAISDGLLHDLDVAPDLPAPLHLLQTGRASDWDRRLVVKSAPAFGILGEELRLVLTIEDQGAMPPEATGTAQLSLSLDGEAAQQFTVPVGQDIAVPLTLPHGGLNVIQAQVAPAPGELTERNNSAVIRINGVRDRLRVLLISGEPHAGERTWRNLLKSDVSVDLVHFTILRPPEKQDGVPVEELSLIAFPTRELFVDKLAEFDLVIFDRYRLRGILPAEYFENIRRYVEQGGAVLVAAGPEYATVDSLWRSPLGTILPARPTGRVIERPFLPMLSELGRRHPVTEGLEAFAPPAAEGTPRTAGVYEPRWGRWLRRIEIEPASGAEVVMEGDGAPLLTLTRVGEGRVALLASDQAWLWARGFEGGGPQLELLRRLAHWMMKEPELEEEALEVEARGQELTVTRRSLSDAPRSVEVTRPDGSIEELPLEPVAPGRAEATLLGDDPGLYRFTEDGLRAVAALGPAAPREFEETVASPARLAPLIAATRGGSPRIEAGLPALRRVGMGRPAAGRGWIGITPRGAWVAEDVRVLPLAPPWLLLLVLGTLSLAAWLWEGRRPRLAA